MKSKNPVEKRSRAAAEIVLSIEREILSGTLAPGQRIDEVAIAESFNVSRTPVREALLELAAGGLVEQRAHRGSFVIDVTLEEIFDVYEVLAELKGLCARLAARRMEATERRELMQLHEQMGALLGSSDRERYIELDNEFHGMLVHAARNATLKEQLSACLKRIAPVRRTSMEMLRDMREAHAEHGAMVEAITAGNAEEAKRIMIGHVSLRAEQAKDLIARWKTRGASAGTSTHPTR